MTQKKDSLSLNLKAGVITEPEHSAGNVLWNLIKAKGRSAPSAHGALRERVEALVQEGGHGGSTPPTGTRGLGALMTDLRACLPALIWRQLSAHTSCMRTCRAHTCAHVCMGCCFHACTALCTNLFAYIHMFTYKFLYSLQMCSSIHCTHICVACVCKYVCTSRAFTRKNM